MADVILETLGSVGDFMRAHDYDDYYARGPEPLHWHSYRDSIRVVELANAGRKGKECIEYSISWNYSGNSCSFWNWYIGRFGESLVELLANLRGLPFKFDQYETMGFEESGVSICRHSRKGCVVVSPFAIEETRKRPSKRINLQIQGHDVIIDTHRQIQIGSKVYRLGDICEQGSYNLVYTRTVLDVTEKTVESEGCPKGHMRDSIAAFVQRNWNFDLKKSAERNANWSD